MTQSVLQQTTVVKFPWLMGKQVDLVYFLGPAVVAMFMYSFSVARPGCLDWLAFTLNIVYILNIFHAAATYFHFTDKRNRAYYFGTTKQKLKFIVLPVAILTAATIFSFTWWQLVATVYLIWSIPHLGQQNFGILTLYHNHNQGEAMVPRDLEQRNLQLSALFYSSVGLYRFWLSNTQVSTYALAIVGVIGLLFFATTVQYLWSLISQVKRGAYINAPAIFFWFVSITFFIPMMFLNSLIMLTLPSILHWWQYIGLNYIMVKRKYSTEQAEFLPWPSIGSVSSFLIFCSIFVVIQYGAFLACNVLWPSKELYNHWSTAFVGLGLIHYLLDGFIWKFREKYNRDAMLPYLLRRAE